MEDNNQYQNCKDEFQPNSSVYQEKIYRSYISSLTSLITLCFFDLCEDTVSFTEASGEEKILFSMYFYMWEMFSASN